MVRIDEGFSKLTVDGLESLVVTEAAGEQDSVKEGGTILHEVVISWMLQGNIDEAELVTEKIK